MKSQRSPTYDHALNSLRATVTQRREKMEAFMIEKKAKEEAERLEKIKKMNAKQKK